MKKELLGDSRQAPVDKTSLNNGSLVRLEAVPDEATKQDIKIALLHSCVPSYVDYIQGTKQATVRFPTKDEADSFIGRSQNIPFTVKDCPIKLLKVPSDQEEEYFKKINVKRERLVKEKGDLKKKSLQKSIIEQKKKTHKKKDVKDRAKVLSNCK